MSSYPSSTGPSSELKKPARPEKQDVKANFTLISLLSLIVTQHRVAINFCGSVFCELAIFCILGELIFAIVRDWFFLLGINFCDFQEVTFN